MSKPSNIFDRLKYYLWKYIISPVFPYLRNTLLKLRIMYHEGRQPWHLGHLHEDKAVVDFEKYLMDKGCHRNKIAWIDSDEILSLRLLDGHKYQYHIRVFKDREIRAHYEKTPEIHPFGHFFESVFEARTEEFKKIVGDWCKYKE